MNRFAIGAGGFSLLGLCLLFFGGFLGGKSATPPAQSLANGYATSTSYATSGKTVNQTLAEEIKGDTRTMTVHSGLLVKDGQLAILNNLHYKDAGNLPTVVPSSLLPLGGIDALKGRMIVVKGSLTKYKDKPQWAGVTLDVK
jgi:hypothetical protein